MSTSGEKFQELQHEFEENLERSLEQKEIDFLHWLANKMPDEDYSLERISS